MRLKRLVAFVLVFACVGLLLSVPSVSFSKPSRNYFLGVFPPGNPMDGYGSAIQLGITRPRLILSWNMFEPSKGMYNF